MMFGVQVDPSFGCASPNACGMISFRSRFVCFGGDTYAGSNRSCFC
jgi:hypothetical protein